MFWCKAQVAGQQISTPPILYTAAFKRGGIWSQHIDAKTNTIFGMGASLYPRGLVKKKLQELPFNRKLEDFENHLLGCLIGLWNEFNLNPYNFFLKDDPCQFFGLFVTLWP